MYHRHWSSPVCIDTRPNNRRADSRSSERPHHMVGLARFSLMTPKCVDFHASQQVTILVSRQSPCRVAVHRDYCKPYVLAPCDVQCVQMPLKCTVRHRVLDAYSYFELCSVCLFNSLIINDNWQVLKDDSSKNNVFSNKFAMWYIATTVSFYLTFLKTKS